MSLSSFSVHKPITISMFFFGIILIGVIAFQLLPVEMMPNTSFGDITINIDVRGGIPASDIEKSIAKPVEEAVSSVSHLKNILSISKEGNATVILEFEPGTNMDFAALEVREKFNRVRNKLPSEIEKPVIAKYEYTDVPIMILAVTSNSRTPEELRKIVDEKIRERIQRVEGVARAEVIGGREGKILIEVDQAKLQSYAISLGRIVDIINVNNYNLLAGEIKREKDKYIVRTIGEFQNLADLENLVVATTEEGSVIRLKDVAQVKDYYLEPVALARLNAQPVVSIYVQKESLANTVKISKLVKRELASLKKEKTLDQDISITPTFNQAEAIQGAVDQVTSSLKIGAVLATLVLFVFLRQISTNLIIASSIPLSILCTFSLMFFSKLTINVMTLSGLALGVGMLVDNAIVVLDNILKKRDKIINDQAKFLEMMAKNKEKETSKELAIEGADEMFLAITASTLTHFAVFLPLVFINPEIRMLYSGIALTITYSLLASLLTALTLVPMLASRMKFKIPKNLTAEEVAIAPLLKTGSDPITEDIAEPPKTGSDPVFDPALNLPHAGKFQIFYKKAISGALTLRYLIVILAAVGFVRILQESKKLEREFIGIAEQNKFTVFVELPTGTKLEVSDKIVSQVEKYINGLPEIKSATSKIEPWSSKIFVELQPLSKRKKSTAQLINELRPYTEKMDPAFIYYEEPEEVGTKEILIELYGPDYEVLKSLAVQTAQRIQGIPRFTDTKIRMREGRPEMQLLVDKRQAAMFGLSVQEIALALHTHMRGLVATQYRGRNEPLLRVKRDASEENSSFPSAQSKSVSSERGGQGRETETIVRMEEKYRKTFETLRRVSLVTPSKEQVYLSQLARFKFDVGPSEIWRKNKSRMVQVSANTGGLALGSAAERVNEALKGMKLPKDYFWQLGGNYDKMIRNQRELTLAIVLSLVLVFMVLASLFESFAQPFIILMTVPLAAIGAILALRITHTAVGTGVLIGAIMLGGIVVNNAIVLVDRINFLRRKFSAYSVRTSIIISSYERLRPIVMTSLTTILGLIPMAIDKSESAQLWSPLAITAIGGLTVSTFLTLFVIPCIYLIFRDLRLVRK